MALTPRKTILHKEWGKSKKDIEKAQASANLADDKAEMAGVLAIRMVSGTTDAEVSRDLDLKDVHALVEANHATVKIDLTIEADVFDDFTTLYVEKTGAADVEILSGSGVTINGNANIKTQFNIITIQNKGNNVWTIIGGEA